MEDRWRHITIGYPIVIVVILGYLIVVVLVLFPVLVLVLVVVVVAVVVVSPSYVVCYLLQNGKPQW